MEGKIRKEIDSAIETAKKADEPPLDELMRDVYSAQEGSLRISGANTSLDFRSMS